MYFSPLAKLKVTLAAIAVCIMFVPIYALAAPSTLVIDEFQIAGKTAYDEYLVIANYGHSAVPLAGYKVLKYTAAGAQSTMFSAFGNTVLGAGQKLMICNSDFTGFRSTGALTYTGSIAMAPNNSISLVNGAAIVDLVGYGTNGENPIKYVEGEAIDPSPLANQVLTRTNGLDTDDNNVDFVVRTVPVVIDVNAPRLVISELLPSPATGEEWFELYNPTNLNISLANLKTCDALGSRHCYFFDKTDYLRGGEYKVYSQSVTKITLNNNGDWLELYDVNDNLLADSGGDYGAADKGVALAVFGTDYRWTATPTPGGANQFTDIVEVETETVPKAKTTKSKVVAASKKSVTTASADGEVTSGTQEEAAVKAADTKAQTTELAGVLVDRKTLGWGLIGLAILLVVGYTLWYFRDYAKEIYYKIKPRDDSARF
jgi:hypothetical protein